MKSFEERVKRFYDEFPGIAEFVTFDHTDQNAQFSDGQVVLRKQNLDASDFENFMQPSFDNNPG